MRNQGIGRWIDRKVEHVGREVAIAYRDERVHYALLAERIAQLADALRARGVRSGERVAYLGNNHPSFLEALFATATLGAIFVPLNTRLAPPEIAYMLIDSGAKTLIFHDDLRELAEAGSRGSEIGLRIAVAASDGAAGSTDDATEIEHYEAVVAAGDPARIDTPVSIDDPAIILYTSGTTGHPKGAVISHANIVWNSFNVLVDYGVSPGEKVLLISPLFHVAALSNGAMAVLLQGGTVVLHEKFDASAVLETIERERITMLSGVPTTYQLLQEHPSWDGTDISSLQRLTCGGSAVPERTMRAYEQRGLGFSVGYGMTETSPGATAMPAHQAQHHPGSSGLRHFFTDVKIVGTDGEDLPTGEVGEILISGPNVISEYWHRPEATAEAFVDGWLRSGDLGYLDERGYLYVSDRLKDMVISGGENIYSAEVEGVILELPEVAAAALIGVPDDKWGEVPHVYVELQPERELTAETLVAHVTKRLARYKVPKRVVFVTEFPRTASGKIRKAELRKLAASESA